MRGRWKKGTNGYGRARAEEHLSHPCAARMHVKVPIHHIPARPAAGSLNSAVIAFLLHVKRYPCLLYYLSIIRSVIQCHSYNNNMAYISVQTQVNLNQS